MAENKYVCQECGCNCESCINNSLHLHQEIEILKQQLLEREHHIVQMETNMMNHARQYPNGEWEAVQEELQFWNEKYDRLYDSHKRLQKVNQGLEDKLLKIVDKFETEKTALTRDLAELTSKLTEARLTINELEEENNQYRNDCNIAVQLLQCKPSNFVAHKLTSLPIDLQEKVKMHMNYQTNDTKRNNIPEYRTIRVPIPTFPPTAMVYSVNSMPTSNMENNESVAQSSNVSSSDYVSAAIMAKVLEERTRERNAKKSQDCRCNKHLPNLTEKSTQTNNSSTSTPCMCDRQLPYVHSQRRSESFSSTDSYVHTMYHGTNSTETII